MTWIVIRYPDGTWIAGDLIAIIEIDDPESSSESASSGPAKIIPLFSQK